MLTLLWHFDLDFAGLHLQNISFFDIFDYVSANIIMPLGGLLTCIFVAWWMKPTLLRDEITNYGALKGRFFKLLYFTLRYITPLLIIYIFVRNLGIL